jgi:predicted ATPase
MLSEFQQTFQIIIATHSPFVLFQKNINIIDLETGYQDTCIKMIKQLAATNE